MPGGSVVEQQSASASASVSAVGMCDLLDQTGWMGDFHEVGVKSPIDIGVDEGAEGEEFDEAAERDNRVGQMAEDLFSSSSSTLTRCLLFL